MSKAEKIFTGIVIMLLLVWVIAISIERKITQNATATKITAETELVEEVYTEIVKAAYFEPQEVTEGENGDFSNSFEIWDNSMGGYSCGRIADSSGDFYSDMETDPQEIIDGWIYVNEPYQFNSTYMGVHKITDTTSPQWEWLQSHEWSYTDEGICCYDGRILVALAPIFGTIGDYVDLLLEDGTILYCIIGDEKANSDTYGHWSGGLLNVIEIIVSEDWYSGHENKYYPVVIAYR